MNQETPSEKLRRKHLNRYRFFAALTVLAFMGSFFVIWKAAMGMGTGVSGWVKFQAILLLIFILILSLLEKTISEVKQSQEPEWLL
jgi:hypothetical protein